ncbi:MAG: TetR/AcrR family transcriptional regulator [Kineosporiaceae bacterium]
MAQSKRDRLVQASWTVIAEKGLAGLRVEDVAARVGVAASLVYYHFGSRAGLLEATMSYADSLEPSSLVRPPRPGESARARLDRALLSELGGSARARANSVVWNELTAGAVFDRDLRARVRRVSGTWTTAIAACIGEGQRDGSIRSDADAHDEAELLSALVDGLLSRCLAGSLDRSRARRLLARAVDDRLGPAGSPAAG